VPVGDAEALADRLAALLADPGLRRDMGVRARLRAEREFSIDRTVQGFQELLVGLGSR
jgi:glycosyltransferase involved in cell wall biosynthesis